MRILVVTVVVVPGACKCLLAHVCALPFSFRGMWLMLGSYSVGLLQCGIAHLPLAFRFFLFFCYDNQLHGITRKVTWRSPLGDCFLASFTATAPHGTWSRNTFPRLALPSLCFPGCSGWKKVFARVADDASP